MAFASMAIIFLLFCIFILFLITLSGIITIIVSALHRIHDVQEGSKPRKAGLITGIILTVLPLALIVTLWAIISHPNKDNPYIKTGDFRDTLVRGLESSNSDVILSVISGSQKEADPELKSKINDMLKYLDGCVDAYYPDIPTDGVIQNTSEPYMYFSGVIYDNPDRRNQSCNIHYYGYAQYEAHPEQIGITGFEIYNDGEIVYDIGIKPKRQY